jgi:DNA-binding transcriptional ArsR family regulator
MEALADYFKVFSEPNRLAVLEALSQALVSMHLRLLALAGVISRRQ